MARAIGQTHAFERFLGAPLAFLDRNAGVDGGKLDIFKRRGARQKIELLEDKSDLLAADFRKLGLGKPRNILAVEKILSRVSACRGIPRMFISVDFPEPDEPITATNSPG